MKSPCGFNVETFITDNTMRPVKFTLVTFQIIYDILIFLKKESKDQSDYVGLFYLH